MAQTPDDATLDQQLIAAINRGDAGAFEKLYRRHRDWVLSLSLRFTANHQDALDVTQDVFVYLAGKFPGFVLTARMTTFLYPAVKNLSLRLRRRRKMTLNEPALLAHAPARPATNPDASRAQLALAIGSLPEIHREVILMRFVDDFSLAEIAHMLRVPVGTIKSRLHLAIATLRQSPSAARYFLETHPSRKNL